MIALGSLILLAVIALAIWPEREPAYKQRALHEWLLKYDIHRPGTPQSQEAASAIRKIGTNALPFLVRWIRYEEPVWRKPVNPIIAKLPKPVIHGLRDRALEKAEAAKGGFRILGVHAKQAIPQLVGMINDPRLSWSGQRAIDALANVGSEGCRPLVAALTNSHAPNQWLIGASLRDMELANVDVTFAVPILLRRLETADRSLAADLKSLVDRLISQKPSIYVSSLTNIILGSDHDLRLAALQSIAQTGEHGTAAVAALLAVLEDPDPDIRVQAASAIAAITHSKIDHGQKGIEP